MDGAIPDGEGTAFPLVSTTSVDALENLRASLQSYLDEDGERRKAVFATSRELTPIRRRNLLRAASDLGFTLVQIYDQAAFADLLYRSPEWCRELLNLSGTALSALPLSSRPDLGNPLVGRDADLEWLSDATGDAVLIGQPGSGKTSLLRALVTRGLGLFAVSDDRGRIAEAIRAQAPELFVDDAHLQPGFLLRLAQLRKEMKAGFRIVATCWPGEAAEVAKALGLSKSGTRELSLLDRKAISEVIRSCGIAGPPRLLRELIDQAKGRPGLAVTLCFLCRREGVREVVTGMGLYEDVRSSFAQIVGPAAVPILAAFAVGGDQGMPMEAVAQALGVSLLEERSMSDGSAGSRRGADRDLRPRTGRRARGTAPRARGPGVLRGRRLAPDRTALPHPTASRRHCPHAARCAGPGSLGPASPYPHDAASMPGRAGVAGVRQLRRAPCSGCLRRGRISSAPSHRLRSTPRRCGSSRNSSPAPWVTTGL